MMDTIEEDEGVEEGGHHHQQQQQHRGENDGDRKTLSTWHLVAYNFAIVFGTAFMCGFTFPAYVKFTALSPHNDGDEGANISKRVGLWRPVVRRDIIGFSILQLVTFQVGKLIAFLGVASTLGNKFGRRKALMFGALMGFLGLGLGVLSAHVPGSSEQDMVLTVADAVWSLATTLLGLQNGIGQVVAPNYLIELAPTLLRGSGGLFYEIFFWIGVAASFVIEKYGLFASERIFWHILIGGGMFIYVAHFIAMWLTVESPLWLIHKRRDDEALEVLRKIRQRTEDEVVAELKDVRAHQTKLACLPGARARFCDVGCFSGLFTARAMWPVFLGCSLMTAYYLTGAPLVFEFQTSILKEDHPFLPRTPFDFHRSIAIFLVALPIVVIACCALIVDRFGRRNLVLVGLAAMVVAYLAMSLGVYLKAPMAWQVGSVLYMAGFSLGPGAIATFMIGELFDQNTRLTATSICHLVTQLVPVAWLELFRFDWVYGSFVMPVGIMLCVGELIVLFLFLPETMNLPMEHIVERFGPGQRLLQAKWPARQKSPHSTMRTSRRISL